MLKVFVSQPMAGKSLEQLNKERQDVLNIELPKYFECDEMLDVEIIDSFLDIPNGKPLEYLGESLKLMADADLVVMIKGWREAKGCVIEHQAAFNYEIKTIYIDDDDYPTIYIPKSEIADSRTCDVTEVGLHDLYNASAQHVEDVQKGLAYISYLIEKAGNDHDYTKLNFGIHDFYDSFSQGLSDEEFKAQPWYQRHIHQERHHVNEYCHDDVNLIDIIEHIVDIVMAGIGRSGEVTPDELDADILQKAYANTIELMKEQVKLVEEEDDDDWRDYILLTAREKNERYKEIDNIKNA